MESRPEVTRPRPSTWPPRPRSRSRTSTSTRGWKYGAQWF